jgi:hypothetical protein
MATGRELETVVSDFLTKLDAQQQSALEVNLLSIYTITVRLQT